MTKDTADKKSREIASDVLRIEGNALLAMADAVPEGFDAAVQLIMRQKGRAILCGMGKSGHVAKKIAATLASTGTPSFYVHPGEASHGDLGMVTKGDVAILLSNSGETAELTDIIAHCQRFIIPMIAITGKSSSTLAKAAEVALTLPDAPEACAIGMAPTTSTTMALALGDALAVAVMRLHGFEKEHFLQFHPGGKLGAQLLRVKNIMHSGDELPLVDADMPMTEALVTMTSKGFGTAGVIEQNKLIGIITDGDLRRHMDGLTTKSARDVATIDPRTVSADAFASEALALMQEFQINSLFIPDDHGTPIGLIHIHDCLRAGVI
ncbi:MAG: KpsF/GutQ family sugar-phosphate isomerase [Pseudomonadota bacterium]